jgi:hypothetical protein
MHYRPNRSGRGNPAGDGSGARTNCGRDQGCWIAVGRRADVVVAASAPLASIPAVHYGGYMPEGPPEFALVDFASMRGLEIGPLANPRVPKDRGSITYLDHASTEDLKKKYATNGQLADQIDALVDVDIVQGQDQTLLQAVGAGNVFDYVIAAHVFEHIPFMVDWLSQVESVLVTGGILSLVVPDKRFTFDVNRRVTEFGEVLDAHLRNIKAPTYAQMFDFFAHTVTIDGMVDTPAIWAGTADYSGVVRDDVPDSDIAAFAICQQQQQRPSFVDIHCLVFTPASFLDIFEKLVKLDLVNFEIGAFFDTRVNTFEFHVSLRKVDLDQERSRIRAQQYASVRRARQAIAASPRSGPTAPATNGAAPNGAASRAPGLELSGLEQRALLLKRRVMHRLRHRVPLRP